MNSRENEGPDGYGNNASHNEGHDLLFDSRSDFAARPARANGARTRCNPGCFGLTRPLFITAPPGDSGRLFIVQQNGQIRILNLITGTLNSTPFLALTGLQTGGEQGLLGMAFDPNYAANGKFYLNFTVPGGAFGNGVTHVSQFTVSTNPNIADPTSERILLTFDHPQANHNGGWIGFSPRAGDANNLYIATGDGGGGNDQGPGHIEPGGNAQSLTTLLRQNAPHLH
jgi:glucose/arabinose dehydrogenase